MAGSFVRCATSAVTARARIGRPCRFMPSWCFSWSTTPTGWEPMRRSDPPPERFHVAAYAACEPEWLSSARSSRIAPPDASSNRRSFAMGGA